MRDRSGLPPLLVAPFAFGLALLAGLYAFAEVSGGHFNPAVSIGLFLDRRIDGIALVGYWVVQFCGRDDSRRSFSCSRRRSTMSL